MANKLLKSLNFGGADTYYVGWDSIKDAPFGEKEVELLNGTYEFVYDENMGGAFYDFSNDAIKVGSGGNILKVVWDGTEYECVSEFMYGMEAWGNIIGDGVEPFAVAVPTDGSMQIMSMPSSTNETHTIKITMKSIEKIDSAYIPMGRLVYVQGVDNDHYMYSDFGCQNKLTYSDFVTAIDGLNVVINVPLSDNYFKAITAYPVSVDNGESAMCIGFYYMNRFRTFYTAEYTG